MSTNKHLKATELYHKMLLYGAECVHCGLTYEMVKKQLCANHCEKEEDIDKFLHAWFDKVYLHDDNRCSLPKYTSEADYYQNHLKICLHFLQAESVIQLHKFELSEANQKSNASASRNGNIAIVISVLGVLAPIFFDKCYTSKQEYILTKQLTQDSTQLETQQKLLETNQNILNLDSSHFAVLMNVLNTFPLVLDTVPQSKRSKKETKQLTPQISKTQSKPIN